MLSGLIPVLIALAGCLIFVFRPAWFPLPISADALAWDGQFARTLWATGVIFVLAHLTLAWTLLRSRKRRSADQFRGSRRLELLWTSATAALFLGLALLGSRGWAGMPTPGAGKEVIRVEAHQFAWSFHYPGPDGVFGRTHTELINDSGGNPIGLDPRDEAARDDTVTATLRIPVKRDVLLLMRSRDVIHDFFVRELRTKQDIVPGMEIPLELRVETPGTYEIACAELCGLGHSQMRSLLIAMPAEEYDLWKRQPVR